MMRPEHSLFECQRAAVERLSFTQTAASLIRSSQVVQVDREFVIGCRVTGFTRPLENRQSPSIERLGLIILALPVQYRRKRGDVGGHMRVVRPQSALSDLHRAPSERLAL